MNRPLSPRCWALLVLLFNLAGVALIQTGCEQRPQAKQTPATQAAAAAEDAAPEPVIWPPATMTNTFIDRVSPAHLRIMSYNILWNSLFKEENELNAARFARVIRAMNPDILALQEIGLPSFKRQEDPNARDWNATDVAALMTELIPPPKDARWYAHQGSDNVIVSKYPLKLTRTDTDPPGDRRQAIALVDLPDLLFPSVDVYVFNNHYKCCGDTENDPQRQKQSDAIMAWIRDARTPGGHIDLPISTAFVVLGDLNIVGGMQPVLTLLSGDVIDEATYGPDFNPDWDDSGLVDAHPTHNDEVGGPDFTWRNDNDEWPPGRLDFVIYADSLLKAGRKFVLNTTTMSEEDLAATGLQALDVVVDTEGREFDHLPVVVDLRMPSAP